MAILVSSAGADRLCCMCDLTSVPAANDDIRDNSPTRTAAQMIRASLEELAPGSSAFGP